MSTDQNARNSGSDFQFANSERIYVEGKDPSLRIPFREVHLNVTRSADGQVDENQPVRIYDTSGPWGDPAVACDVHDGLKPIRREWIAARGDVEEYEGRKVEPRDDGYLTEGAREF